MPKAPQPKTTVSKIADKHNADTIASENDKQEGSSKTMLAANDITFEFLERDTMGATWYEALRGEFTKSYFIKLKAFIAEERKSNTIYPSVDNIYSWSRLTPLDTVKVVILGQDPYHDVGQAHGLSFSVLPPTKLPGSLRNIYKEIKTEYPSFVPPTSGDLTPLAEAGVLWLNASLTVRAHKAGSHSKKGWEQFTKQALQCVANGQRGVVFMAWGLPAQKTIDLIGVDESRHLVLRSAHPSPLSAHRGFLGNGHFQSANEWLQEKHGQAGTIDWEMLSAARKSKSK
ncbi:Uracil-DNA glycosylase [Mycena indigotica]|uniref:Uracil-DNA glycosylase n=1 Tax=Mycena indigotica TaxID=2126181 RepID=A0A8H6VUT4_9AGAR|nr:Uracil-DNA glycosylase [Mycena indigotica]KAF7294722.1 Uracil-DNA glycosylase [Mycena indigotica]